MRQTLVTVKRPTKFSMFVSAVLHFVSLMNKLKSKKKADRRRSGRRAVAKRLRVYSKILIIYVARVRGAFFQKFRKINKIIYLGLEKYFQKFIRVKSYLILHRNAKEVCCNKPLYSLADCLAQWNACSMIHRSVSMNQLVRTHSSMIYSIKSRCTLIGPCIFWKGLDIRLVPFDREKFSLSNCVLSFF
jgi:hypothetical protein